jgi:hypothetical protein
MFGAVRHLMKKQADIVAGIGAATDSHIERSRQHLSFQRLGRGHRQMTIWKNTARGNKKDDYRETKRR